MIYLRWNDANKPTYMTRNSAGADLRARESQVIPPLGRAKVPTGVWIDRINWDEVPRGFIPEIQIRARSGLSWKHGIMLANGVGTVDADYPEEICVLLYNSSETPFAINTGDRIAQLVLSMVTQFANLSPEDAQERLSGFGSTGNS